MDPPGKHDTGIIPCSCLGSPLNLVEVLKVGDGFAWSGWNERFLSAGWDWTGGSAYVAASGDWGNGPIPFGGLGLPAIPGAVSADGSSIHFAFENALAEGSWLFLVKQFAWTGEDTDGRPRSILLAQSPVPVPGALWLLGSGILGLVLIRRQSATVN